jgi:hypothetical protein
MPNITDKPYSRKWAMIRVGAYVIDFGVLMGLRYEFEQYWVKNAIAGCAGAFMGMALYECQKGWRRKK